MKFLLFSKITFEISNPIALIECYCFQNDFYANYDLREKRIIEDVNRIGARMDENQLQICEDVIKSKKNLAILKFKNLNEFLELNDRKKKEFINELNEMVIKELLKINGIGFSKVTKILHTIYPKIIPIIDNQLQKKYQEINKEWQKGKFDQLLFDYYKNLKEECNETNLDNIYNNIKNRLVGLTKVRIFDILWWSYLKAEKIKQENNINWSTVK